MKAAGTFVLREGWPQAWAISAPRIKRTKAVSPRRDAEKGQGKQGADWFSIRVHPCDLRLLPGCEKGTAALSPEASIRVISGPYTWSIPVRMFNPVERTRG